jgi:hypothetical protein
MHLLKRYFICSTIIHLYILSFEDYFVGNYCMINLFEWQKKINYLKELFRAKGKNWCNVDEDFEDCPQCFGCWYSRWSSRSCAASYFFDGIKKQKRPHITCFATRVIEFFPIDWQSSCIRRSEQSPFFFLISVSVFREKFISPHGVHLSRFFLNLHQFFSLPSKITIKLWRFRKNENRKIIFEGICEWESIKLSIEHN